ncbi:P-loop containing nucleoside triphosphate hydrolase protein [Hyaloscypha sp. PMI_1271]|nr:P-loop containing nucleoside triphosphate hydrolase protein [Hyaloscypha sp. PMI_1271]
MDSLTSGAKIFTRNRKPRVETFGKKSEIKNFYANPSDDKGADRWIEWAPPSHVLSRRVKWEGFAIQVYRESSKLAQWGNNSDFVIRHITLLSPYLRSELKDVLEGYGVVFDRDSVTLDWPLQPLFFARHHIAGLKETVQDGNASAHLDLLYNLMEHELAGILDETEDLEKEKQITHALLWTLFPKRTIVVTDINGTYRGYRVLKTGPGGDSSFIIECEYVRFDGVRFGYLTENLHIRYFEGKRDITNLEVYPLASAIDHKAIRDGLINRGRRVLDFQGIHYMRYLNLDGRTTEVVESGGSADMWGDNVHARVIIDFFHSAKRVTKAQIRPLPGYNIHNTLNKVNKVKARRPGNGAMFCDNCEMQSAENSKKAAQEREIELNARRRPDSIDQQRNRDVVLTEEENLLIMCPNLDGFSLISKSWRTFSVERISALELNSDAFDHLVHSRKNKDMLCSLVEDHKAYASSQDDVIVGKGRGLLILLSGTPGTGKTLMAEAIADRTRSPLYYVDARDLGSVADMDVNLRKVMADAAEWNALLLIDEADIYLQERSSISLERNEIVSIFLRRLEYFKGTMFLTTNLWETIDPAIESRIQAHLQFPRLLHVSRTQIWQNFLARIPNDLCKLTSSEIEQLGRWDLNGRDIKNALKMTGSWCRESGNAMTFEIFEDIIKATRPRACKKGEIEEGMVNGNGVVKKRGGEDMVNLLDFDLPT